MYVFTLRMRAEVLKAALTYSFDSTDIILLQLWQRETEIKYEKFSKNFTMIES